MISPKWPLFNLSFFFLFLNENGKTGRCETSKTFRSCVGKLFDWCVAEGGGAVADGWKLWDMKVN